MKKNNFLSWVGIFLLMTTLMALSCHKDKKKVKVVPTASFTITTTMTTATFSINASNYTSLSISIDGAPAVSVGGSSYTVSGLIANKNYVAVLTATNANGSATASQSFTTAKSSLAINSFTATDTTATSITFNFASSSDATITSASITNTNSNEIIDVMGKSSQAIANLIPNFSYTFIYKVKDNTGNEVSKSLTFKTKEKVSDWLSIKSITYGEKFAIIGNALSSKLTIVLNNNSGVAKVDSLMKANFGANGKAVKMLRYSLNGNYADSNWVVLPNNNGITFKNLSLNAGDNIITCYFALLPNVGDVANGSVLSFTITSINDGEGGTIPIGGFPVSVDVGTVNANTAPTMLTTTWIGDAYINATTIMANSSFIERGVYQAVAIKATGPAGARLTSIRLMNPYSASGLVFDDNTWIFSDATIGGYFKKIISYIWENEFIHLTIPNENNSNLLKTDGSWNNYKIKCNWRNSSNTAYSTGEATPGRTGFQLMSKYDIGIKNSDGQFIDLSDVVVKHGDKVLD